MEDEEEEDGVDNETDVYCPAGEFDAPDALHNVVPDTWPERRKKEEDYG